LFPSEQSENPHKKGYPWKKPIEYQQARSAGPIVNFALSYLPNYVTSISSKNIKDFLAKQGISKCLLFTDKTTTPNLYKSLSVDFKDRLLLGEVRNTQKEIVEQFDVSTFPTLVVIKENEEREVFQGKINYENLLSFLTPFALPPKQTASDTKPTPTPTPRPLMTEVTDETSFNEACISQNGNCIIAFMDLQADDGTGVQQHPKFLETFTNIAKKYKNQFHFMWLDGIKHYSIADQLQLRSGFPAAVLYNPKRKFSQSKVYQQTRLKRELNFYCTCYSNGKEQRVFQLNYYSFRTGT